MDELRKKAQAEREALDRQYKKQISELEADLKEARKGFDAER